MCDHRYRVVAFALMAAIAGSSVGDPFDAELSAVEEAIAEHEQQLPTNNAELVRTRRDIAELAKQKLEQQVARDSAALEQIERTLVGQARSLAGSSIAAPSPLPATGQVEQNGLPSAISGAP
ncbi:MAG: hypothetical protein EOM91_24055, partial [Sphingobacteriia bacterium]|nr:hypothetical protein [Sphingobacteriia bacterium]